MQQDDISVCFAVSFVLLSSRRHSDERFFAFTRFEGDFSVTLVCPQLVSGSGEHGDMSLISVSVDIRVNVTSPSCPSGLSC